MKGLIYKDFLLMKTELILALIILFICGIADVIIMLGAQIGNFQNDIFTGETLEGVFKGSVVVIGLIGVVVVFTTMGIFDEDEKAEWYRVLYASPITLHQELLERYLFLFLVNVFYGAVCMLMQPMMYQITNIPYTWADLKLMFIPMVIGILIVCIRVPFDVLFPTKKSNAIFLVVEFACVLAFVMCIMVMGDIVKLIDIIKEAALKLWGVSGIVVLLAFCLSYGITYSCKRRRRTI